MVSFFERYNPNALQERVASPLTQQRSVDITARKKQGAISMKEVAKHNTKSDCWVVLNAKVYDVSGFVEKHPGGDILMSYAGMDATDIFEAFHDPKTHKQLETYLIGEVSDAKVSESLQTHRKMAAEFADAGFYEASMLYYAYKFLTNVSILSLSIFISAYYQASWRVVISGFLMGLFWQQCGWLSHDFLHHQVFKNRKYNNFMGYLIGNVFQGFSVSWWKAKHNQHHATPNVAGFDPDIDTLPFLAWSEKLIEGELTGLPEFLIKNQYIMYFPLLSFARISWLIQSWLYAKEKSKPKNRTIEVYSLFFHYIWYFSIMIFTMNFTEAFTFIMASQCSTGLMLAAAFSLNHNGMVIYQSGTHGEMDFNELQIATGRDVSGPFVAWFMGGLNYQIEHHLFPRIPRHNLPKVQDKVMPMAKKFNIPYHKTGFISGTIELMRKLYTVSATVKKLQ